VLVTTLTKRMAEDLAGYYTEGRALPLSHSEIETWKESSCCRLRRGEFDVLIGINYCAKGWTCRRYRWWRFWTPTRRVFCGSAGSLIQTMGRASRHLEGKAIPLCRPNHRFHCGGRWTKRPAAQDSARLQRGARHHPAIDIKQMDMGLAEIMKAEYGEVAEEETAVMPELATQAELDA